MGGLPEKPGEPGGRKALPKTHRGLTALGPAPAGPPQMGRRARPGRCRAGAGTQSPRLHKLPAVASKTRGHCPAIPHL